MRPTAWADDELQRVVVQALADGGGAQEVTRAVRASLRAHLALMQIDPRCDLPTRAVLEEWISGRISPARPRTPTAAATAPRTH